MPVLRGTQRSVFLGSMLGDGGLHRNTTSGRVYFVEGHAENQKDYLQWKHGLWGGLANPLRFQKKAHVTDEMVVQLFEQGKNIKVIARELECPRDVVTTRLARSGVR